MKQVRIFNKIMSVVLAMVMVVSMLPMSVFAADGNVAKVGNTEYATIDEAIANWTNGTTLTLLDNVTLSDVITLSSTEHHILDLGTYTMTAAKNKDAIQIANNGRSSASYALDIKADATNPGGITATGKAIVRTAGKSGVKDRPIIRFYNGVFNGSYIVYHTGSNGTNCPQFQFHGGEFNGTIYTNRALNQFYGGTFTGSLMMSVDSSAYTLVAGGTFKQLSNLYMSALNSDKFTIGSSKGANNGSVCIDEDGNYVITTTTPTVAEASVASNYNSSNYFYYSTVNTNGMYYEDVYMAMEKNNSASTQITVYVDELDMTDVSYKGTIVVPEGETITIVAEAGTTPTWTVEAADEAAVTYVDAAGDELVENEDGTLTKPAAPAPAVKIGEGNYSTLTEALTAAAAMNGDVTVEIYDKVTLNSSLSGSYDSITFVGKDTDAEIYLDVQGYITATGKKVAFEELTLSKSQADYIYNAGFMNVAFGVYDVVEVTYTGCTFANGAYASSGKVTYTDCDFYRSWDKYGLWAYGDVDVTVEDCTFADYRGIKMYAEGAVKTVDLTVTNTDFSALTEKPAIVLTYGKSVILEGNTYSSTGVFELDLDGAPNGTTVTSDVAPTCKNDNGACGVLVDGKIYTTVAQAAEVATAGSEVTLLHDSTETVEFVEGVILDKNGYTAAGVTVAQPAAGLEGEGTAEDPFIVADIDDLMFLRDAVNGGNTYAGQYFKLTASIDLAATASTYSMRSVIPNWEPIGTKDNPFKGTFDGAGETISNLIVVGEANQGLFGYADNATIKNVTIENAYVKGTDCVGAVAGQVYSISLVDNCHVSGTIQIEGQTNVGGIVGKYYTKVTNCSVIGNGVDTSYVKGVYVKSDFEGDNIGGIMGHCGEDNNLTGNAVKNITVSGTRKVGGIVGIADQNTDVSNNVVENVVVETTASADYAQDNIKTMSIGGLIGQYQAAGTTNDGTVTGNTITGVTFTIPEDITCEAGVIVGGARGGSTGVLAPSVNVTAENNAVTNVTGATNKYLMPVVATVNGVEYGTLAEAVEAVQASETITLMSDTAETVTIPDGVTLNGNGFTINGTVTAGGDLTIAGNTTVTGFSAGYYNHTITIGEGASLKVTGGRITVSYGNVFNITGTIADAKTADKSTINPSLELTQGISFTGNGGDVQFNVTNAYVKLGDSTTKNNAATGTFNVNATNSIVDFTKTLKTYMPTASGLAPVFNATFADSVVDFASHLELWLDATTMTVDNTDLTVEGSFANAGTLNVTNGSNFVVKAPIMSSHGGNTGTINVTGGTFELVDSNQNWVNEGTMAVAMPGKLIVNDFDCGTTGKITIDTTNMSAGDSVTEYIVFNKDTDVVYNDVATIGNSSLTVNEEGVLVAAPVAKIGDVEYTTLEEAFKAATSGCEIDILANVTVDYKWDSRYTGAKFTVPVTINGNHHTLTFTNVVNDGYNQYSVFRFESDAVVNDLTIDMTDAISEFQGRFRAISAKGNLTVDNCTFIGNGSANNTRAIIFGEGGTSESLAEVAISVTNSNFTGWRQAISDNENGKAEVKSIVITGNTMTDAGVNVSAFDSITFTDNTVEGKYVKLVSYTADNALNVTATDNTLTANADTSTNCNRIEAGGNINAQEGFVLPVVAVAKIGDEEYTTLAEALAAANGGEVEILCDISENIAAIENVTLFTNVAGGVTITSTFEDDYVDFNNVIVKSGITLNISDVYSSGSENVIEGTLNVGATYYHSNDAKTTIQNGGKVTTGGMIVNRFHNNADSGIYVYGDGDASTVEVSCADTIGTYSGTFYAKDAVIEGKMLWLDYKKGSSEESDSYAQLNAEFENSVLNVTSELRLYKDAALSLTGTAVTAGKVQVRENATPTVNMDATSSVKADAVENLAGASLNAVLGEDGTVTFKALVAEVNGKKFATLQDAIDAAQAGETVTVIADVSDEAVTVDKNLTITGSVTLNNVSINANGADELTVSGLTFTGNSWINSGSAEKLTVSGVTANVTPSNGTQTNSRSAFISLGRSEQQSLELVVEDSNIVSAGGSDPILGWACITKATLTGNTFGSADAHQNNSDSVKFMSIAAGAEFTITGNTVYSDYNGIVFAQNTTRGNAYTVNLSGNTFVGGADHIWLEITGGNTCNATVNATSDNTVNGNAMTVSDLKAHTGVIKNWTSYVGVDVVTNADGKVIGGTLAFYAEDAIAEGYEVVDGVVQKAVAYLAEVEGVQYETVAAALAYAQAENMTDVVITLIGETTKDSAIALGDSFNLMYSTAFDSVTFKQADASKVYCIDTIYTGDRTSNDGEFVFDGVNICVISQYMFEGNVRLTNNSVVKSVADANCFFYYCTTTIEPGSKLDGVIEDFRGGDVIVDGGKTDGTYADEPGLHDSIMTVRWSGDSLTLKNGAYVKVNAVNEIGRLNIETGTSVNVYASKLEAWEYIAVTGTLAADVKSLITTKKITGAGTITIDATGFVGESVQVITADMSGFTGTIEVTNGKYEITDTGVTVMPKAGLSGSGTEEDPYLIKSIEDLILFRDSVNAGETIYNAAGVYVALGDNIDMAGIDWSVNIGDDCTATFDGIFDGQNYTIYNLTAVETAQKSDGYVCTGLFGAIYGSAVVKNLTIENVNIDTGSFTGNNVAAVVGFAYSCTGSIENVKVTGNININATGIYGVGAIVGYDYYSPSLTIKECVVDGADGSVIAAKSGVGGIIGYASTHVNVTDCVVQDISAVGGVGLVGGIAGIMLGGGKAENNTIKNVDLTVTGEYWQNSAAVVVGTVSGDVITVSDTTVEDVTINGVATTTLVGSQYAEQPTAVVPAVQARIGNKYYTTLAAALKANVEGEVILLTPITIAAGETVTIDLNGKTVSYSGDKAGEAMITNKGNLTITDSTTDAAGKIVYTYTGAADSAYTKGNYTICNTGTLTVEKGTVENATAAMSHACYTIDNNSINSAATLTINGGKVLNNNNYAVRQIGGNHANSVTVNGGEIEGTRAIWVQLAGSDASVAPEMNLTVTDGILTGNQVDSSGNKLAIYSYSYGNDMENVEINISGGTFNGDVALTGGKNKTNIETVNVSGGTFKGVWGELYSYGEDAKAVEAISITGGTFATNGAEMYALDDGYKFVENADGTYSVVVEELFEIAMINMRMGQNLSLMFAFEQGNITDEDLSDYTAKVSIAYKDERGTVSSEIAWDEWTAMTLDNVPYYVVEVSGLAAKEMDDDVTITICKGDTEMSKPRTTSLRLYGEERLHNSTNSEFKTTVVDMLNYGAAAQKQMTYNVENLANRDIDAYQELATAEGAMNLGMKNQVTTGSAEHFAGVNMRFRSDITMLFAVAEDCGAQSAKITFVNHRNINVEKATEESVSAGTVNGKKARAFEFTGMVVADINQPITVEFFDADGNVVLTLTSSINAYLTSMQTQGSSAMKDLAIAFGKFSTSSYAYQH